MNIWIRSTLFSWLIKFPIYPILTFKWNLPVASFKVILNRRICLFNLLWRGWLMRSLHIFRMCFPHFSCHELRFSPLHLCWQFFVRSSCLLLFSISEGECFCWWCTCSVWRSVDIVKWTELFEIVSHLFLLLILDRW